MTGHGERATFVTRLNRFVALVERSDGREVRAYLPNTARLTDVLVPGAPLVLTGHQDRRRATDWTVTRVWDGTWVALAASVAADLVADHLRAGRPLPGWRRPTTVRREVSRAGRRFDLEVGFEDGSSAIVEVKSLSRARDRTAPLSSTPSTRGVAHLEVLGHLAESGAEVAVVFVVQREDVDRLDVAAPADPAWVEAVRRARARGVEVHAYSCRVDEHDLALLAPVPVVDVPDGPAGRGPFGPPIR
jgi:sugar fermentation stimulation protein A